jgi:hypothetical protein
MFVVTSRDLVCDCGRTEGADRVDVELHKLVEEYAILLTNANRQSLLKAVVTSTVRICSKGRWDINNQTCFCALDQKNRVDSGIGFCSILDRVRFIQPNLSTSFPPLPDGTVARIAREARSHLIELLQSVVVFQRSRFTLLRTEELGGGFHPIKNRYEIFVVHVDLLFVRPAG